MLIFANIIAIDYNRRNDYTRGDSNDSTINPVSYETIHIVEQTPTKEQLEAFYKLSGFPLKKFFNTSGNKYKELGLKDKLASMTEEEQLQLLASDGMLIKRPIVTNGKKITLGFKESDFLGTWK